MTLLTLRKRCRVARVVSGLAAILLSASTVADGRQPSKTGQVESSFPRSSFAASTQPQEFLQQIADDSLHGRLTGSADLAKVVAMFRTELERSSLSAVQDNRSYLHPVPLEEIGLRTEQSWIAVRLLSEKFRAKSHFLPLRSLPGMKLPLKARVHAEGVVGGRLGSSDMIDPAKSKGKVVLFQAPLGPNGLPVVEMATFGATLARYDQAAAILIASLDWLTTALRSAVSDRVVSLPIPTSGVKSMPPIALVTRDYADRFLPEIGKHRSVWLEYEYERKPVDHPAANIVAVVRGSDELLANEYIMLSAHLDHLGVAQRDLRESGDSIYNGADEGGTGAAALLHIAKLLQSREVKPKRSILFVWTVGQEQGFLGAKHLAGSDAFRKLSIRLNLSVDLLGGSLAGEWEGDMLSMSSYSQFLKRFSIVAARDERSATDTLAACATEQLQFRGWGVPTVTVSAGVPPYFHRVSDDLSNLSPGRFAQRVVVLNKLIDSLADSRPQDLSSAIKDIQHCEN